MVDKIGHFDRVWNYDMCWNETALDYSSVSEFYCTSHQTRAHSNSIVQIEYKLDLYRPVDLRRSERALQKSMLE